MAETHTLSITLLLFLDHLLLAQSTGKIKWGTTEEVQLLAYGVGLIFLFGVSPLFVLRLKLVQSSFLSKLSG